VDCASDICAPVLVLTARVTQVQLVCGDRSSSLYQLNKKVTLFRLVMNDGTVRSYRGDRVKTRTETVFLLTTKPFQLIGTVKLTDSSPRSKLILKPAKVVAQGCPVPNVTLTKAFDFNVIF